MILRFRLSSTCSSDSVDIVVSTSRSENLIHEAREALRRVFAHGDIPIAFSVSGTYVSLHIPDGTPRSITYNGRQYDTIEFMHFESDSLLYRLGFDAHQLTGHRFFLTSSNAPIRATRQHSQPPIPQPPIPQPPAQQFQPMRQTRVTAAPATAAPVRQPIRADPQQQTDDGWSWWVWLIAIIVVIVVIGIIVTIIVALVRKRNNDKPAPTPAPQWQPINDESPPLIQPY